MLGAGEGRLKQHYYYFYFYSPHESLIHALLEAVGLRVVGGRQPLIYSEVGVQGGNNLVHTHTKLKISHNCDRQACKLRPPLYGLHVGAKDGLKALLM